MTARVTHLQIQPEKGAPHRPVGTVRALVARGLEGDRHAKHKPGSARQVLILEARTLQVFALSPGDLREQITVSDGAALEEQPEGTRVRIGGAVFELSGPCEPCLKIGAHLGHSDPEAFRRALIGQRGVLARVIGAGEIAIGDPVTVG